METAPAEINNKPGFVLFAYGTLPKPSKSRLITSMAERFGYNTRAAVLKNMERKRLSIQETHFIINFLHKNEFLTPALTEFKAQIN